MTPDCRQSGDIAIEILFLTMYQLSDMCQYQSKWSGFHLHSSFGPVSAVQHAAHATSSRGMVPRKICTVLDTTCLVSVVVSGIDIAFKVAHAPWVGSAIE